jgi:hypothetical protein
MRNTEQKNSANTTKARDRVGPRPRKFMKSPLYSAKFFSLRYPCGIIKTPMDTLKIKVARLNEKLVYAVLISFFIQQM